MIFYSWNCLHISLLVLCSDPTGYPWVLRPDFAVIITIVSPEIFTGCKEKAVKCHPIFQTTRQNTRRVSIFHELALLPKLQVAANASAYVYQRYITIQSDRGFDALSLVNRCIIGQEPFTL